MKLECSVEKIKNILPHLTRVTGKNLTLPILDSILMIASQGALKFRSTNLNLGIEIEIPAKVEKNGSVAVRGEILGDVFLNIQEDVKVSLEQIKNNLIIKTLKSELLIKTNPIDDFPTIPGVSGNELLIHSSELIEGIKSVFYSSAVSDIKPEISSVCLYPARGDLIFAATDSFRLAEKKIKVKDLGDFSGILIPFRNVIEILKIIGDADEEIKIRFNESQISFSYGNVYLTSRVISGSFPDYEQIIPKEKNTEAIVLKHDILSALKLSNVFTDRFNQIGLSVKPKSKIFEISAKNADVGENRTRLKAKLLGENIEVSLNHKYFLDCFQSIHQGSISLQFENQKKPMVVRGLGDNSFTYLIMPMSR